MVSFLATPTTGIFDTAERVHNNRNLGQREAEARATHRNTILDGHSIRDSRKVVDEHNRALTANQNFALSTAQTNAARDAELRRVLELQNDLGFTPFPELGDYPEQGGEGFTTPTAPAIPTQGSPILSGAGGATTPAPTPGGQFTTQLPTQQASLPPNPAEALNVTADLPLPGAGAPHPDPIAYQQGGFGAGTPGAPRQTMADVQTSLDTRVADARKQGLATAGAPTIPTAQPQQLGQSKAITDGLTKREQARTYYMNVIRQQEQQLQNAMQLAHLSASPEQAAANVASLQQQLLTTQRGAQLEMDLVDTEIYSTQGSEAVDRLRAGDKGGVEAILGHKYGAPVSISQNGGQYTITVGNNVVAIDNINGIDNRVRQVSVQGFIERQAAYLVKKSEQDLERYKATVANPQAKVVNTTNDGTFVFYTDPNTGVSSLYQVNRDLEGLGGAPKTGLVPAGSVGGASGGFTTTDFLNLTQ